MKKKLLIGGGILLTIFIIFLILIGGASTSNNVVTEEELKTMITSVDCEIEDEENINYDIATLTNSVSFDGEIQSKNYTKITIDKESNFKTYGVAFTMKSNESFVVQISLNKNGTSIADATLEVRENQLENVDLLLDTSIEVATTDTLDITFEQGTECPFVFDTLIFLFDEV